jgi:hypothetical protein
MRYEDLCLKLNETVDALLDFLDLSRHKSIEEFISMNTHENPKSKGWQFTYSTKRKTSDMAFEWRKHIKNNEIYDVQRFCEKPMKILGYNSMTNISINKLDDRYPLVVVPPLKLL